jgi:hypothetical protein
MLSNLLKEVCIMQSVQEFQAPLRQPSLHISTVQPSLWEQVKARVTSKLTVETIAELVFGAITVLLTTGLFVGLARALAHYTIIPLP